MAAVGVCAATLSAASTMVMVTSSLAVPPGLLYPTLTAHSISPSASASGTIGRSNWYTAVAAPDGLVKSQPAAGVCGKLHA